MRSIAEITEDVKSGKELSQSERPIAVAYIQGKLDAAAEIKARIDHDLKDAPYMYDVEHLVELYGYQDGLEHALNVIDEYRRTTPTPISESEEV